MLSYFACNSVVPFFALLLMWLFVMVGVVVLIVIWCVLLPSCLVVFVLLRSAI